MKRMVDVVVRSFLGGAGSALLDLYLKNSLVINGLVFLYVVIVIISRRTYHVTLACLLDLFWESKNGGVGDHSTGMERSKMYGLVKKWNIPWNQAIKAGMFPFIVSPKGILIQLKTPEVLQRMFTIEVITEALLKRDNVK